MKPDSIYKDALKVSCFIFLLGVVEFIIFTVFMNFRSDILLGVLYGCAFSSASFFHLAYSLKKSVKKGEKAAQIYMSTVYTGRMLTIALAIFVAIKVEQIYLWSAIIPLGFTRIAVYIASFIKSRSEKGSE